MTRPSDDVLLGFLEGTLDPAERDALLARLDRDPGLARELRQAAMGLFSVQDAAAAPVGSAKRERTAWVAGRDHTAGGPRRTGRQVSPWWIAAASAATLLIAVPVTTELSTRGPVDAAANLTLGRPDSPEPSFVLVLHGRWPDTGTVTPEERVRRAAEYWNWTSSLATQGVLVAAGDLRWEPGQRLGATGMPVSVDAASLDSPEFLVGMLALRVGTYEAALAVARACPHLKYGGSVSVRQVGSGFVTVPGNGDWKG